MNTSEKDKIAITETLTQRKETDAHSRSSELHFKEGETDILLHAGRTASKGIKKHSRSHIRRISSRMTQHTPEGYKKVVEGTTDKYFEEYQKRELGMISHIPHPDMKTIVDLGSGSGRILEEFIETNDKKGSLVEFGNLTRNIIAMEINKKMYDGLCKVCEKIPKAKPIRADITKLGEWLTGEDVVRPVLLMLLNTIGTIEGSEENLLYEMRNYAKKLGGEIIISFLRQESLGTWGMKELYPSAASMTGRPDWEKSKPELGLLVSDTGYTSKWRSCTEILDIKNFFGGFVVQEVWTDRYCILHITFHNKNRKFPTPLTLTPEQKTET